MSKLRLSGAITNGGSFMSRVISSLRCRLILIILLAVLTATVLILYAEANHTITPYLFAPLLLLNLALATTLVLGHLFRVDITERKGVLGELRQTRAELESRVAQRTAELAEANEDLRQNAEKFKLFAYSAMHDLKSPAIGACGLARLLQKQYGAALDAKAKEYCEQIARASEHITELVEKINLYIATKEAPLTIESVSLESILRAMREEFSSELDRRGINWLEPEPRIEVWADRLSLLRAFRNYIDNALKYGGEGLSEIRIDHREIDGLHVFSVTDDGEGMKQKDSAKIFQVFQRNGSSNGVAGTGLGLAIVKEVAERHGGKVWVESEPARGSTFYFSIAKAQQRHSENNCRDAM